jgi:hypothetical protein
MRVTISHREVTAGLFAHPRHYFIDVTLVFSEEERAIVDTRKLYPNTVDLSPGFLGSSVFYVPVSVIKACLISSPFLFLSGCMVGCVGIVAQTGGLGSLLVILSFLAFGFGLYAAYFVRHGFRNEITIGEMLSASAFSVMTFNPVQAKLVDAKMRERLADFKRFLEGSVELAPKETFEL